MVLNIPIVINACSRLYFMAVTLKLTLNTFLKRTNVNTLEGCLSLECTYPAINLDLYRVLCSLAIQYNTGICWLSPPS